MKLHKNERGYKNSKTCTLPKTPYLSPPLATSTKKETKPEAERKDPAAK
jgi:hypothetical protein